MCSGIQPPTSDKHRLKGIITVNSKQLCRLDVVPQFVTLKPTWKLKAPGFLLLHYRQFTISGLLLQLSLLKLFPLLCFVVFLLCMQDVVFFHSIKLALQGGGQGEEGKKWVIFSKIVLKPDLKVRKPWISAPKNMFLLLLVWGTGESCAFQQQTIKLAQLCCSTTAGDVKADLKLWQNKCPLIWF